MQATSSELPRTAAIRTRAAREATRDHDNNGPGRLPGQPRLQATARQGGYQGRPEEATRATVMTTEASGRLPGQPRQ
ncbi:MAG: hypothetical protein ACLTBV_08005 [Enterocloster bolteae]